MTEYQTNALRRSVEMYTELDFNFKSFLRVGGKSVNTGNGVRATNSLLDAYEKFCNYILFSHELLGLYSERIDEIGESLNQALVSATDKETWIPQKERLENILGRVNIRLHVC